MAEQREISVFFDNISLDLDVIGPVTTPIHLNVSVCLPSTPPKGTFTDVYVTGSFKKLHVQDNEDAQRDNKQRVELGNGGLPNQ